MNRVINVYSLPQFPFSTCLCKTKNRITVHVYDIQNKLKLAVVGRPWNKTLSTALHTEIAVNTAINIIITIINLLVK